MNKEIYQAEGDTESLAQNNYLDITVTLKSNNKFSFFGCCIGIGNTMLTLYASGGTVVIKLDETPGDAVVSIITKEHLPKGEYKIRIQNRSVDDNVLSYRYQFTQS